MAMRGTAERPRALPAEVEYLIIAERFHVPPHEVDEWPAEVVLDIRQMMHAEAQAQARQARQRRQNARR